MQFCMEHWDKLRAAVEQRGLSHLVARSGEQAVEDAVADLEGTATLQNWDPLMAAHWAIAGRVLERMGLAALGDICPLCEVQKSYEWWETAEPRPPEAMDAQGWIDSCMDSMLHYARQNNLVGGVQ